LLPDQLFRLDGKVAVITGSTRGIGLAAAHLMAMAGARLVISSRKPESCESVRAELAAGGFEVIAVPCHVGRDEDRRRLIDETMRVYGQIDVLIANAAVNPVFTPLQNLGEDVWEKVLETNLTSPWRLAQMALPLIADRPAGGSMILVSSIASLVGVPNSGAYAISKAAENHLARQLALEWGPRNVRINVVAPGTTRTDMIRSRIAAPGVLERDTASTALRRIAEATDVAAPILFLASEAARHITGQVLIVDGGQTLSGGLQ
jgi:NAD(P)-dependent dehydrogenase (short-subunit alcohol dehydrogenase family)